MRARLSLFLLAAAALRPGASLAAQAVDRTDTPRHGAVRLSFDPQTMTWQQNFTPSGRQGIGAAFIVDSASTSLPSLASMQRETRTLTGLVGYIASLGHDLLAVRAERRIMPIGLEYGISDRLSLGVTVPIVRVEVRAGYRLHPPGANVGTGPRTSADSARYLAFFTAFDAALGQLSKNIADSVYGPCSSSPTCQRAQAAYTQDSTLRSSLNTLVFGAGGIGGQYLPLAGSDAGRQITALIAAAQRSLADTFQVSAFNNNILLLPEIGTADPADVATLYSNFTDTLALAPYANTRRRLRFFSGDVEVQAKLRLLQTSTAALAGAFVVRLPTGHQESPNDPFDISTGDHQTDLEGRLTGEVTLAHRIWLNAALRAARQLPGSRYRRVGPPEDPFLLPATPAHLRWDPGDYVSLDVAPMFRFSPRFAVGVTASYYAQGLDHYSFFSATDSTNYVTHVGGPADVSVLNAATAIRQARLGFALTYAGPRLEGGFSVQQTVSGAGGLVPVATVFRIVMRQTILLF